jgi:2-polyprenyl-6-methoxyphenol hydroxylase-like FAD-dependent oxidoreductase
MSKIVVLGSCVIGLSTAMLLARQGHDVTVFERDNAPVPGSPEEAWSRWERNGVVQFRMPHYLHAAGRQILDEHLPDVKEAMLQAGCVTFDNLSIMPPFIADRAPRAGDERFVTVTGRRPAIEYAVARTAENLLPIERGVSVAGLLTGESTAPNTPHVSGIRTADGTEIQADLVVDAMGRASKLPEWLEAIGARRPIEEAEDSGFIYYTRYFRGASGALPPLRAGLLTPFDSFSLLTIPSDNGTWSVTVYIYSGDPALKALRDPERWTRLVAACPAHAHLLDGQPITDVLAMGGITDRYRRLVVDGTPVATGIVSVGDASECTNPSLGRGITMGLIHAVGTAEVVRQHADDPLALALAHDSMTEERLTPWYRATVEYDRGRTAQIAAVVQGQSLPAPTSPADLFPFAMLFDADLFRAFSEIVSVLALPRDVFSRPGLVARIMEVAGSHPPPPPLGPSREEVLRLLA